MARPKISPEEAADTRESLLDAAQELYESGGSEAMSFRAIADLAGCSHSKLYSYFDSKADLIDGLRLRCYRLLFDTLTEAVAAEDDPVKSLESLAHAYIALGLNKTRFYGLLYTREGKLTESESPLFEAKVASLGVCESAIAAAADAGVLELTTDPLTAAHIFWAGAHGLVELCLGDFLVVGRGVDELSGQLIKTLISGLSSEVGGAAGP